MFSIAASSRPATSRLAASRLRTRAELRIEIGGEPGAVGVKLVHPLGQRRAATVRLEAAIHRGVEHVQRLAQALGCLLDEDRITHDSTFHRAAETNENVESAIN